MERHSQLTRVPAQVAGGIHSMVQGFKPGDAAFLTILATQCTLNTLDTLSKLQPAYQGSSPGGRRRLRCQGAHPENAAPLSVLAR